MNSTLPAKARPLDCPTCGGIVDRRSWRHRRHARKPRPYSVDALARAMGIDPATGDFRSRLSISLGIDASWVKRELQDGGGLTARTADHWAARAGLHADIVWPGWWDDAGEIEPLPGEDDPPIDDLDPVSDEKLEWLRQQRIIRGAAA